MCVLSAMLTWAVGEGEVARNAIIGQLRLIPTYGPPRRQAISGSDLSSLRQRIRPVGWALAKMEIRAFRSS